MALFLGLRPTARELGISHVALLKAANTGRVKRLEGGLFDVEACRRDLEQNSHPIKSRSARAQQTSTENATPTVVPVEAPPEVQTDLFTPDFPLRSFDGSPDKDSVAEATRQLEWEKLREKRLKLDREEGKLVEVAEINAWVAGMILEARDELIRIPTELRDDLAVELDPIKCEVMLAARIHSALAKMSEYKRAA